MKVCCDSLNVSSTIKKKPGQQGSMPGGESAGQDSSELFELVKLYINDLFEREFNKKRW
jgi:hypothetical protein